MSVTEGSVPLEPDRVTPGVGSALGHGWHRMFRYFLELLLITVIGWLIGFPASASGWAEGIAVAAGSLGFVGFLYGLLIVGPVDYGVSYANLKAARGESPSVEDLFAAFKNYWNAVLANVLVCAIVLFGLVLLIVPGIVFACKLAFVRYLVVDRRMDAIEAVKTSWRMTGGYGWKVFLLGLCAIPIGIGGLLLLLVGVVPAIMWIRLAFASLYHGVSMSSEEAGGR